MLAAGPGPPKRAPEYNQKGGKPLSTEYYAVRNAPQKRLRDSSNRWKRLSAVYFGTPMLRKSASGNDQKGGKPLSTEYFGAKMGVWPGGRPAGRGAGNPSHNKK